MGGGGSAIRMTYFKFVLSNLSGRLRQVLLEDQKMPQ